jgi:hypothetical protein
MSHTPSTLTALKLGALGGFIVVFIALLGMIEAFAPRDIVGGVIDMGRTLILVSFFFTGFLVFRQHHEQAPHSVQPFSNAWQVWSAGRFLG